MKKLISLLLVLCMAFSLMAMSVSAEEVQGEPVPDNHGQDESFVDDLEYAYGDGVFSEGDLEEGETVKDHLQGTVTRGEFAVYMARAIDPEFASKTEVTAGIKEKLTDLETLTDVEMQKAIVFCYNNGIVNGYMDNMYHADYVVTREEACAMLYRALVKPVNDVETAVWADVVLTATDNVTTMTDYEDINEYAVEAVDFCIKYGIIIGNNDGSFGANAQDIKLVHLAAILNRTEHNDVERMTSTKFYLGVTSGEGYAKVAVNHAYVMQISLSEQNLDPSKVTLSAEMNDVASLKVTDTRRHEISVETGLTGSPALPDWMEKTWDFKDATINITIKADGAEQNCQYIVSAERVQIAGADTEDAADDVYDLVITFKPEKVEDTRKAWQLLVNDHLYITERNDDDSKIVIGYGSYLHLGEERLEFEGGVSNDLTLDNFSDLDAMKQNIKDTVCVTTYADQKEITAYLALGTALRVGQTEALLDRDVTLTIDGVDVDAVDGCLSDIRAKADEGNMALVKALIGMLDAAVGAVDAAKDPINVVVVVGDGLDVSVG